MDFKDIFEAIDVDSTGYLSYDVVQVVFKSLKVGVTSEELYKEIRKIDVMRKGSLNKSDFFKLCKKYFGSGSSLKPALFEELETLVPSELNNENLSQMLLEFLSEPDCRLLIEDLETSGPLMRDVFLAKIKENF